MAETPLEHLVLTEHLRVLVPILDAAYGMALAADLERRYRNLHQHTQLSPLTKLLEENRDRFEAYAEDATRGPEPVEVGPDE